MERLTYTDKDGGVCCPWERNSVNGSYDIWDEEGLIKQLNRLAAYEDTGLEPDAVNAIKHSLMGKSIAEIKEFEGIPIQRLRELAQAEQDGRLVALPCKVVCGTTIWWADSNIHTNPVKCEVSSFGIYTGSDGGLQLWMNCYVYGSTPTSRSFRMSSIGKTVFLTREEAALAGKGGDG